MGFTATPTTVVAIPMNGKTVIRMCARKYGRSFCSSSFLFRGLQTAIATSAFEFALRNFSSSEEVDQLRLAYLP
jgi:hypothetical protein